MNIALGNQSAPSQIQKIVLEQADHYGVGFSKGTFGPFETLQCEYEIPATAEHSAIRVSHLAVTHPKTHAAYLLMFESPVEEWSRTWPMGEMILNTLALNGKV